MKTKWLIGTGQIVLFLLLLLNFEVPDAVARTNLNSASGDWFVKETNKEIIRNNQCIGSEKISTEINVTRIEYFFDTDPGYGNGTPILFTSGGEITIDDAIPVNSLNEGIHIFYVRVCDDAGHWSQTLNQVFLKTQLNSDNPYNITRVEYFFDTDPGYGNGTVSELTAGSNIVLDKIWPTNSLSEGIHILYIRVMDEFGQWSETYHRTLLKTQLNSDDPYNIIRVEYFFDTDPGIGKGTTAEFTLNSNIILDNNWPENSLSDGVHMLYIRALDEFGQWSQTFHRLFLKTQLQSDVVNIEDVEYFFDTDPGLGKGIKIEVTPGEQITVEQILPIEDLEYGIHSINIRGKFSGNKWGQIYHSPFIKYPSYDVVKVEYFFDEDPGHGNGTDLPVAPSEIVEIDDILNIQALSTGTHTLNVRALSENDLWSDVYKYSIEVFLTGIDDHADNKSFIIIYPNPTKGLVNIEVNKITEPLKIQVVSSNGSILSTKEFYIDGNATFDLSSFSNGVYILRFVYNNEVRTQSIVLNK